jgi:hypothetical protein
MARFIIGVFAAVLLTALGASPSAGLPGDPLDTDGIPPELTGYAPMAKGGVACSRYVNKRTTLFPLNGVLKCTIKNADAVSKGSTTFDSDVCQNTASYSSRVQYDEAITGLEQSQCPDCLPETVQRALFDEYRDIVRSVNGLIYCDSSSLNAVQLDDGSGWASKTRDVTKCENKVARNVAKSIKCLKLHCHQNTAEAVFNSKPSHNALCEDQDPAGSCLARYTKGTASLIGCPTCLNKAAVFPFIQQALDSRNVGIYCTDP